MIHHGADVGGGTIREITLGFYTSHCGEQGEGKTEVNEVVITEKTSQAVDVRSAVGSKYGAILPAEGHLLDLREPEEVDPAWKEWSAVLLKPPGRFGMKPAAGGNKAPKLKAIMSALKSADRVWLATDCDREGQLIGQEILEYAGFEGEVRRVLFTAQDPRTIREAFEKAKPNGEYFNLYAAGVARREADQIFNLSLTRTATVKLRGPSGRGVIGVGRVKTPTLALVCARELAIRGFRATDYWEVAAQVKVASGAFRMRHAPKDKITDKARAEEIAAAARGFQGPLGVKVEDKRQRPPRLHDLPSLQKVCGSRFGWGADKTLQLAQELYAGEGKKILSYPRAEVRYLPESAIEDVGRTLDGLRLPGALVEVPEEPVIRTGKAGTFSDKQLEGASHHAIVPNPNTVGDLQQIYARLSKDEVSLFDLVARSYLGALMEDYEFRQTKVVMDVGGCEFRATGRQNKVLGWKAAVVAEATDNESDEDEGEQVLPEVSDGEEAKIVEAGAQAKKTRPPKRFSEGALVDEMKNAWRHVEDEALRDRLKEAKGIGTPATRAEVIAGLKRQGFLVPKGKNVVPTDRGLALYEALKRADPDLVDAGLTAEMEMHLDEVVSGGRDLAGAVDAVCEVADRMIGKIVSAAGEAGLGEYQEDRAPTAAMKRYAKSLAESKGLKLPRGYASSSKVCRAFLDEHAPRREGGRAGSSSVKRAPSAKQLAFAEDIAREKGVDLPEEAKGSSRAISSWIEENSKKRSVGGESERRARPRARR